MLKYFLFSLGFICAYQSPHKETHSSLTLWSDAIFQADYSKAKSNLKSTSEDSLFLALTYITEFEDLGDTLLLGQANKILIRYIEAFPDSNQTSFLYGLAKFQHGALKGILGEIISGLFSLRSGAKNLEPLQDDDAKALFEIYNFHSAKLTAWFGMGSSDQSSNIIANAYTKSPYLGGILSNSLFWIYFEEKKYDAMFKMAKSLHEQFPENRIFKQNYGDILKYQKKHTEAYRIYFESFQQYKQYPKSIRYFCAAGNLLLLAKKTNKPYLEWQKIWKQGLMSYKDWLPDELIEEVSSSE